MASDGRDIVSTAIWASTTSTNCSGIFRMDKSYHGASYHAAQVGTDARGAYKENGHVSVHVVGDAIPRPTEEKDVEECIDTARKIVLAGKDKARTVIIEGMSGTAYGGTYPSGYISQLFEIFRENGVRIIVDEILSGYQRTGPGLFAAIAGNDNVGIVDYVCYGKAMTNGCLPFSALVVGDATPYDNAEWGHGATFSGYPIGVWFAHQTLDRHLCAATGIQYTQNLLRQELSDFQSIPIVHDVRGKGMLWTIELNLSNEETNALKKVLMDRYSVRVFGRENRLMVSPSVGIQNLSEALQGLRSGLYAFPKL